MPVSGTTPNLIEQLVSASRNGDAEVVDRLIQEGADVNRDFDAVKPLQSAVRGGHLNVVSTLVDHGARVDFYALSESCYKGNIEVVKFFLEKGCNYDEPDRSRRTLPIYAAIRAGKLEVVELLIQHGFTRGIKDGLNHASTSPQMVKLLLDNGADPNVVGDGMHSPLLYAVLGKQADIARVLLDHGATMRANVHGLTPFRAALSMNRLDVLEVFIEAGYARNFEITSGYVPKVQIMLLLGGASNTPASNTVFEDLMKPIKAIKSAVAALSTTSPVQAFKKVYRRLKDHNRLESLIAFAFEARKVGVDLFEDLQFRSDFVNIWTEQKGRMVTSIISELVYLGCNDLSFFYSVSPFLASADDDMIRHTETAIKYLAGSLPGMPESNAKERTRATRGAILNDMIARASNIGLRPVVKALFGIYHEEWKTIRTLRLSHLPNVLTNLVMDCDNGPFNPGFRAKAMRKLMETIRRHQRQILNRPYL